MLFIVARMRLSRRRRRVASHSAAVEQQKLTEPRYCRPQASILANVNGQVKASRHAIHSIWAHWLERLVMNSIEHELSLRIELGPHAPAVQEQLLR